MWKGEHCGQDVAVKVIRTPSCAELQSLQKVGGMGCAILPCVGALTEPRTEVLQGGRDVEITSASECAAVDRSDDD